MAHPFKVLVVDDEPEIVKYVEHVLRRLGYEPIGAANGEEAVQKAINDPPDLVILDVMMPRMDGFAVCRTLREREATRLVPVIIMTALQGVENRVKLLEHGADDVLTKPVDERELIARVQAVLARKRDVDQRLGEVTRVRDHFAKFVPDAVKRLVAANPDAPELAKQELDVTVLFVDISGYSRLAERVSPWISTRSWSGTSAASWTASPTRAATSTRRRATASWRSSRTATPPPTARGR